MDHTTSGWLGLGSYPTFIKGLRGSPLMTECGPCGIFRDQATSHPCNVGKTTQGTNQAESMVSAAFISSFGINESRLRSKGLLSFFRS